MRATFDVLRKELDERLSRIERRIGGEPVPAPDDPAPQLAAALAARDAEHRDLLARLAVQMREIDALKAQLAVQDRALEDARVHSRQQQANIGGLLAEWEGRLQAAEQARGAGEQAQAARAKIAEEAAFLKAENETLLRRQEEWAQQRADYEHMLQAKDAEVARLFAANESLEDENAFLIKKLGSYQLRTGKHARRTEHGSRHGRFAGAPSAVTM
jgi:chromosome segregation ATPase